MVVILTGVVAVFVLAVIVIVRELTGVVGPVNGDLHPTVNLLQIRQRRVGGDEL